jgi:pentatricopeptide repeat protein
MTRILVSRGRMAEAWAYFSAMQSDEVEKQPLKWHKRSTSAPMN